MWACLCPTCSGITERLGALDILLFRALYPVSWDINVCLNARPDVPRAVMALLVRMSVCNLLCCLTDCGKATVYIDPETGELSYKPDVIDSAHGTAYGYYNNTLNETGWALLEIQTAPGSVAVNRQLLYAAGYLEGRLTAR